MRPLVHVDTGEPYPASLGGTRHVVMLVVSASHIHRLYRAREKNRFEADIGVPRTFRTGKSTEYSNGLFVEFRNNLEIRRGFRAPNTPQQNAPVESAISRVFKAGHAARLGVRQPFPNVRLEKIRGCNDAEGTSLWLELLL